MANTDRARKLLVRTAIVTSTTIATVVGAQNLALLDAKQFLTTATLGAENAGTVSATEAATAIAVVRAAPEITIVRAAPSIVVFRQSGQVNPPPVVNSSRNPTNVIQPPMPSELAAPAPVIIQQEPVPQRSQSTR